MCLGGVGSKTVLDQPYMVDIVMTDSDRRSSSLHLESMLIVVLAFIQGAGRLHSSPGGSRCPTVIPQGQSVLRLSLQMEVAYI